MKVCLLSHSDGGGGAFIGAYRLHQGLQNMDVTSTMLVDRKVTNNTAVFSPVHKCEGFRAKVAPRVDSLPLYFYKNSGRNFSLQWIPDRIARKVAILDPDIIYLHWIAYGFLQIETLQHFKKPLVWKLADMWAFTGGCHYSQECCQYEQFCGSCPQLNSNKNCDLSRWVWQRKAKAWKNLNLTLVSPSQWLAQCAKSSSLFKNRRIEVIPNGIDTSIYKPIESSIARHILNLPQNKKLLLFVSQKVTSDRRKGFHVLQEALKQLRKSETETVQQVELLVVGHYSKEEYTDCGFKSHFLGKLNDNTSLALAYSSADVFVAPSIQDNFPNTVMESLACGTPCVAFNIGGMPDLIEHQKNGYLAKPFNLADFNEGILWVLENQERWYKLSNYAFHKVQRELTIDIQVQKYISLFESVREK